MKSFEELLAQIFVAFPEASEWEQRAGMQGQLIVPTAQLVEVMLFLRDTEGLYFDQLSNLTALDSGPQVGSIEVIYHLYSIPYQHSITLTVKLARPELPTLPSVPSLNSVWFTANWHEREAYDLMGIHFEGHPDLRRILLPADWVGHPLRKDYKDLDTYHEIKVAF
jgi:NADH-quinone oxidoreductase subunit C